METGYKALYAAESRKRRKIKNEYGPEVKLQFHLGNER
jgi:hypothetical protein